MSGTACISVARPSTCALRAQAQDEGCFSGIKSDAILGIPHPELGAKRHVEGRTTPMQDI
jgi:hypothetical protein